MKKHLEHKYIVVFLNAIKDKTFTHKLYIDIPLDMINDILKYGYDTLSYKFDYVLGNYMEIKHPNYSLDAGYIIGLSDIKLFIRQYKINNFLKHTEHDKL